MTQPLPLTFAEVTPADIALLTNMMEHAFDDDYRQHSGPGGERRYRYEQGDFFHKWPFGCVDATSYKMMYKGAIVGAVIVWLFAHGQSVLGLLFVDPAYQNYGIGAEAWKFVEASHPEIRIWQVATPEWSLKDHYFYEQRCGFQQVGSDGEHRMYQKEIIPFGAES